MDFPPTDKQKTQDLSELPEIPTIGQLSAVEMGFVLSNQAEKQHLVGEVPDHAKKADKAEEAGPIDQTDVKQPLDQNEPVNPFMAFMPEPEAPKSKLSPKLIQGLETLTAPQLDAVETQVGPLLVLAGPGSGKTRVITHRIASMVQASGIPPWEILAITFTNKAAAEMRLRLGTLLTPRQVKSMMVCTFHSLCARLLREFAPQAGLTPGYSIYDTQDQKGAMKQVLKELDVDTKKYPASKILSIISNAKQSLLDAAKFEASAGDFYTRQIARIYNSYEGLLKRSNALDFDDLLIYMVNVLNKNDGENEVRAILQNRFKYLLIDEYQDTNRAQFLIAHGIACNHQNICATGDPDQSIYAWRGANIQNILEFEAHYSNAKVIRLEQNYRSTPDILLAADQLIQNNKQRRHKTLWTDNEPGSPVHIHLCSDERDEAEAIARACQDQHLRGIDWDDMAIFYRTNALSRAMEDALRKKRIPYQIAKGTSFYERREIKDAVAYLRAIVNPSDSVNLFRIINTPSRGISGKTVQAIQQAELAQDQSLAELMQSPQNLDINKRAIKAVSEFGDMIHRWRCWVGFDDLGQETETKTTNLLERTDWTLSEFINQVLEESGLLDHYREDSSASGEEERIANLGDLISLAEQYSVDQENEIDEGPGNISGEVREPQFDTDPLSLKALLLGFLEQISLVADSDAIDDSSGSVTMMTLHAAKGLEYPFVAMLGCEENLLPHANSSDSDEEVEEERRLMFVGITRAKRELLITHTRFRTLFGRSTTCIPSRFLEEIDSEDLRKTESDNIRQFSGLSTTHATTHAAPATRSKAASDAEDKLAEYPVGCKVRHTRFGVGVVMGHGTVGSQARVQVRFAAGLKTLVLEYAPLTRLDAPKERDDGLTYTPDPDFGDTDDQGSFQDDVPDIPI